MCNRLMPAQLPSVTGVLITWRGCRWPPCGRPNPRTRAAEGIALQEIEDANLPERLGELRAWFQEYVGATGDTQDKAAKSSDFVESVLQRQFGAS
jgi:hypothetical protein